MKLFNLLWMTLPLLLTSCFSISSSSMPSQAESSLGMKDLSEILPNGQIVEMDNVSFSEEGKMTIYQANNPISLYDRFENQSYEVKSARLYSLDEEKILTLVPIVETPAMVLHFENAQMQRGKISLATRLKGFSPEYIIDLDMPDPQYQLEVNSSQSFTKLEFQYLISYHGEYVMAFHTEARMNGEIDQRALVHPDFMKNNPKDVSFWTLAIFLLSEMSNHETKNAPRPRSSMDDDYGYSYDDDEDFHGGYESSFDPYEGVYPY